MMDTQVKFEKFNRSKRIRSMVKLDLRRALRSRTFYIILACALLVPVLMTVMLCMMDGQENVNPQTGEVTVMHGPESVWQSIGTLPSTEGGESAAMGQMDVMAMCNINMAFMGVAVFVCLFISEDFRSGYAKNLFTVRAKKADYVLSKTLVGFICGALMLILYFIGSLISGAICSLSFELVGDMTVASVALCMLSKICLMLVFVPIFVLASVAAKQRAWLSICVSLGGGMLLFMMVGLITPLNATLINLVLCLVGGTLFATGLGAISAAVLKKTSLV